MFNFIPMEFEELDAVWVDNGTSQYELCINVTECYEGDIRIAYDYLPEICTEKEIKTIHQAIFLIAEQILKSRRFRWKIFQSSVRKRKTD